MFTLAVKLEIPGLHDFNIFKPTQTARQLLAVTMTTSVYRLPLLRRGSVLSDTGVDENYTQGLRRTAERRNELHLFGSKLHVKKRTLRDRRQKAGSCPMTGTYRPN